VIGGDVDVYDIFYNIISKGRMKIDDFDDGCSGT
jgi:hypothetical protein